MVGLPDGEKILRICITVYTKYWRVTDRQTDILPRHSPRYAYASRGKKRLTSGGDLVLDTDPGSLFHFPRHCRIGNFRTFISISHRHQLLLGVIRSTGTPAANTDRSKNSYLNP